MNRKGPKDVEMAVAVVCEGVKIMLTRPQVGRLLGNLLTHTSKTQH